MTVDRIAFFDGASTPALRELLDDADPAERADAACALGDRLRTRELGDLGRDVQDKLAGLLTDVVPMVRFEAAIALAEAKDARATATLLAAVDDRALRLDALRALGALGDAAAVLPLLRVMRRRFMPWADRLQAAAALCALGDAAGAAYLVERLTSRRRAEAAAALHFIGESHHPRARELLEGALGNPAHVLRDVAARTLGALGDPAARAALEAARSTADAELRVDIDAALAMLAALVEASSPGH